MSGKLVLPELLFVLLKAPCTQKSSTHSAASANTQRERPKQARSKAHSQASRALLVFERPPSAVCKDGSSRMAVQAAAALTWQYTHRWSLSTVRRRSTHLEQASLCPHSAYAVNCSGSAHTMHRSSMVAARLGARCYATGLPRACKGGLATGVSGRRRQAAAAAHQDLRRSAAHCRGNGEESLKSSLERPGGLLVGPRWVMLAVYSALPSRGPSKTTDDPPIPDRALARLLQKTAVGTAAAEAAAALPVLAAESNGEVS